MRWLLLALTILLISCSSEPEPIEVVAVDSQQVGRPFTLEEAKEHTCYALVATTYYSGGSVADDAVYLGVFCNADAVQYNRHPVRQ